MKTTIYIALVDDWELRGNGSGDIEKIQFEPMRKLVSIYDKYGVKGSFNAEIMQQLTFRRFQKKHDELKVLADKWDEVVRETYSKGHDIQLHIHPQWLESQYMNGEWRLLSDWSILNHSPDSVQSMFDAGKEYLERLLHPINPDYKCVSFRSGAWCIAPSQHVLKALIDIGIVMDMSIVAGVRYNNKNVQLDYTNCEETFLPFYPVIEDARKVSSRQEEIICVPTNHFYESRAYMLLRDLKRIGQVLKVYKPQYNSASNTNANDATKDEYNEWAEVEPALIGNKSAIGKISNRIKKFLEGNFEYYISDLAQLNGELMDEMIKSIRKRARKTGLSEVPIILENHTKDIRDFSDIDSFIGKMTKADDIKFLRLTDMAAELQKGRFKIVKKSE